MDGMDVRTPLAAWVLGEYGGETPAGAVRAKAERIVKDSGAAVRPIKLSAAARHIGLNPVPVYRKVGEEGTLDLIDGELRICLRSSTGGPPSPQTAKFVRMRFTYAHEMGHALLHDLLASPPRRAAPEAIAHEEEALCNHMAGAFLVPSCMLEEDYASSPELGAALITEGASDYQVSVFCYLLQAAPVLSRHMASGSFLLATQNMKGLRGAGRKKPRCVACILARDVAESGIQLLNTYQGIDKVRRVEGRELGPWSLQTFLIEGAAVGTQEQRAEILMTPGGSTLRADLTHSRLPASSYVWTRGTLTRA